MDYDLGRLGDRRFEHLTQSLAIAALGPSVEVFGDGPDGGREATFDGDFDLQTGSRWVGYGVLQAKYKEHLDGMPHDQNWFFSQLRRELERWVEPESNRRRRPDYLLIATNVRLSGVADSGGIDRLDDLIAEFTGLGLVLKGYQVWHADKLRTLIDNHDEVRRAYADLVLPGDVIARLHDQLQESDAKIEQAWLGHAGRALLAEHTVALGESGDAANTPLALENVAVDLAARFAGSGTATQGALRSMVERADNVLAPKFSPVHKPRVVVLGGPGQGKSTIGRLLCQVYRVAMLASREQSAVGAEVQAASVRMRQAFDASGLPTPTLNRVPVSVTLTAYADSISGGEDISLLRHITAVVNKRASEQLGDGEMKKLLRSWPSIIVLDGLDEVASPQVRTDVVERITDFMGEMAAVNADVVLVCTSRPQGFEEALPQDFYDHLHLERLDPEQALAYANRFLRVRHVHNDDQRELVAERLTEAAEAAATSKLMETPLQVTIMALLLERWSRAPSSRYSLFSGYYDVIYAREVNKPGWIGQLLDQQRVYVNALHEQVALFVHRKAELAGEAASILSLSDLNGLMRSSLTEAGWEPKLAHPLADQIVTIAAERLVLIVPRGDGVGFEVRSLQEFMAARALTAGSDGDVPIYLQAIAASAHWRNTWLLAAGRVFVDRIALRAEIISIVDRIDDESFAALLATPGATLAIDVLDDGLAASTPLYELSLVSSAMRLLDGPPTREIIRLALVLLPRMNASQQVRERVEAQVERRAANTATIPLSTLAFVAFLAGRNAGAVAEWARLRRDRLVQALIAAHPGDKFEIDGIGHRYPDSPWPEGLDVSDIHPAKLDPELLAAAKAEGLSLNYDGTGTNLYGHLEHSLGSFDRSLTDDPAAFREIAATFARGLPVSRWREAEVLRNGLAMSLERDEVGAQLDVRAGE